MCNLYGIAVAVDLIQYNMWEVFKVHAYIIMLYKVELYI